MASDFTPAICPTFSFSHLMFTHFTKYADVRETAVQEATVAHGKAIQRSKCP